MAASDENKLVARTAAKAFGGSPTVTRFWDDEGSSHVDILSCADQPQRAVTSYSTVGLSDWPLYQDGVEYEARLEIAGVSGSKFTGFDNSLATAAFDVIKSQWFCFPGAIFPDVLSVNEVSTTMRHLLFVPPFLWENDLGALRLEQKTVAWLLAVPISENERMFAERAGTDELENLFEERQIDLFDLERPSLV